MKKRTSFFARIFAALALVAAVLAVVMVVSSGVKNDSSSQKGHKTGKTTNQEQPTRERTKAKTYTVKSGDTLLGIAHKTGIRVSEIQALNPEVDPQILTVGEILKLR